MIKIKELSKKFNDIYAVKDLSFDIKKGKVYGPLGPNGAGKTTTMRLMTGYISPDAGDVFIDDVSVVTHPREIQKKIGYMPETNPLYENMLVSEALEFFANLKDIPKRNRRDAYDFVVNSINLNDVFYKPIKELSKGYKQRTGLAIALLNRPDTIILDEPTEGLDPNQRTDVRSLIRELSKDRAILISTHVMQEAKAICDNMFIIANGKLVADGTTSELTQMSEKKKSFDIDIEGKDVESSIRKIDGVEEFKTVKQKGNRIEASVVINTETTLQPTLSKLTATNDWIIWKCLEREEKLEDVFYKLTNPE